MERLLSWFVWPALWGSSIICGAKGATVDRVDAASPATDSWDERYATRLYAGMAGVYRQTRDQALCIWCDTTIDMRPSSRLVHGCSLAPEITFRGHRCPVLVSLEKHGFY